MRRSLLLLVLSALLAACSTLPRPKTVSAPPELKLAPAQFGPSLNLQQHLTLSRPPDSNTHELEVLLQTSPEQVRFAGFALGQRLLTFSWDGVRLEATRHPLLPGKIEAAYVLRDIQYVYWPATNIQQALPAGWQLQDSPRQRTLFYGAQRVLQIQYENPQHWLGRTELDNLAQGYRLEINSIVQPSSPAAQPSSLPPS